ncbi:MAG: hypothetical protein LIP02_10095 [Bacteroidales bacterium]|nr:hypothetical protein [Bacteroidales bacterium]
MSFLIQYSCPECGYQSSDDGLAGTFGMESCLICSCNDCHGMFNRGVEPIRGDDDIDSFLNHKGERVRLRRHCMYCDSPNINIHPNEHMVPCPVCHYKQMKLECIGTCF